MSVLPSTPADRTPIAYLLLSVLKAFGAIFAAAGVTADEFERLANFPRGRLVAALARPERLTVVDVLRATWAADVDFIDFWREVEDGASVIAAQVLDGVACRRCGRAFVVGATSRPDGFGEHGQLFACAPRWGCTLDQHVDEPPVEGEPAHDGRERCVYCGRVLAEIGGGAEVVGHDGETGHVDRACADGRGCNDAFTAILKADQ